MCKSSSGGIYAKPGETAWESKKEKRKKGKDDGNEPTNQFTATTAFFFITIFGYFMDLR